MTPYDEPAFVEDFDILSRQGLDKDEIAARMGIGRHCFDGRVRRAITTGLIERTTSPLRPCGARATTYGLQFLASA